MSLLQRAGFVAVAPEERSAELKGLVNRKKQALVAADQSRRRVAAGTTRPLQTLVGLVELHHGARESDMGQRQQSGAAAVMPEQIGRARGRVFAHPVAARDQQAPLPPPAAEGGAADSQPPADGDSVETKPGQTLRHLDIYCWSRRVEVSMSQFFQEALS